MANELDVSSLLADLHDTSPPPQGEESARELLDAYERDVQAMGDDARAVPLLYAQGRLLEDRLKEPDKAAVCYEQALAKDPTYLPAIHAARRLHSELENWTQVAELLALEAKVTTSSEVLAAVHFERALVLEEKLNQPTKAREAYAEARAANPSSFVLDAMLFRHLLSAKEFLPAYEVLDAMAAEVSEGGFRADLHRQLSALAGPKLGHAEIALAHDRAVLERDPGDPTARAAVTRELRATDKRVELAKTLAFAATRALDAEESAAIHYQAARLYREHLGDELGAANELRAAIEQVPTHTLALTELERIYEVGERWTDLVAILRREVELCTDVEERAHRLYRIGQVFEEKLADDTAAEAHYRQVIEARPGYLPALQALGKLYSRMGAWAELAAMYEAEILATPEPAMKVPKLFKLAEIAELKLENPARAVQIYEQMLDLEPGYLPALKSLGRLYGAIGDWDALVRMFENEIAASSDDQQKVELLDKVGQVYEEHLHDLDKAIATYQRILGIDTHHLGALRTLAQLYLRMERYKELIAVNEQEAALIDDQKKIVSLLHKNGEVYEEKLGDKEKAIDCYKQLLAIAPNYLPALRSLGRLYLQKGRWQDLSVMYRQEIEVTNVPEQAASLHYKIGELLQDKLLDENGAVEAYREVVKLMPTHRQAIGALSAIYRARLMWPALHDVLERDAAATADVAQRAARWCELGELREERLKDLDGALAAYEKALAEEAHNAVARSAILRLLEDKKDYPRIVKLLESALQENAPPTRRLELFLRLGALYELQLGDTLKAMAAYEGALAQNPGHVSTQLSLMRLSLERRDYKKAVTLLESLAGVAKDPRLAVAFHLQAAAIKENHLDPPEPAIANYRAILAAEPNNAHALRALEVELHKAHDWRGLEEIYRQLGSAARGPMASTWLVERAELLLDVDNPADAQMQVLVSSMEALVRAEPENVRAIRVLRRLYDRIGNWQGFLQATELEGRVTHDHARAARLLTDVGNVQWQRLRNADLARKTFADALAKDPGQLAPFLALTELLSANGEWQELASILAERGGQRGEFFVEAGAIYFTKLNRLDKARECFEAALERDPTRADAHVALGEMAEQSADWLAAVEHYSRAMGVQASGEQIATLHARLSRIYALHLRDSNRALSHVRAALAAGPMDNATFEIAIDVLSRIGDFAAAKTTIQKLIDRAGDPDEKARLYCQLGSLLLNGMKDEAAAMQAFEKAQELAPAGSQALDQLIDLYERSGSWKRLMETLRALLPRVTDPKGKARMLSRLAALYAEQLKDYGQAASEMKQAVALDPGDPVYRERLGLLLSANPATLGEAATQFRGLLREDPWRMNAIRALCRISAQQNLQDRAFCFAEVLSFFRAADAEERAYFLQNRDRVPQTTSETLSAEDSAGLLVDPEERGYMSAMIEALSGELSKLYPPRVDVGAYDKADRLTGKSQEPLRVLADAVARALDVGDYLLLQSRAQAHQVESDNDDPLILVVPRELVRRVPPREQRFLLAQHLQALKSGHALLQHDLGDLGLFFAGVCKAVVSDFAAAGQSQEAVDALAKELRSALSRKAKKALEAPVRAAIADHAVIDAPRLLAAAQRTDTRAGILMAADFETTARVLTARTGAQPPAQFANAAEVQAFYSRVPGFLAALTFFLSEEHFSLRRKLRLAIDS